MNSNTKPNIIAHKVKQGLKRIENIKNIIAVTSGKGGVGKSTTAVNLALSLAKNGANVGILDCDIYGPSLPLLLGSEDYKPEVSNSNFVPLEKYGVKAMSFGFLVDKKQPTIWRGAIVNKALNQLLFDTQWGELDYLVIDMPPGTGDIHLTMAQGMPITATLVVTTPQDIALIDVGKSISMFQKLDIPCLGVVENMSTHVCENCGHESLVFGAGASQKIKEEYNLEILANLPLNMAICQASDQGMPISSIIDNPIAKIYHCLATKVEEKLAKLPKDYSSKLASIAVVKS